MHKQTIESAFSVDQKTEADVVFHMLYKKIFFRPLFLLSTVLFIYGCGSKSQIESAFDDYSIRLERVLGESFSRVEAQQLALPDKADLKVVIPSVDINLREFYAIKNCELAALVAQRNTALGKAQLPSQRFLYERAVLTAFDSCAGKINGLRPRLAEKLLALKTVKQDQFGLAWALLFQQSEEVYSALTRKASLIDMKNKGHYQQAIQDWQLVTRLVDKNAVKLTDEELERALESALKRMSVTRLPASLWASQDFIYEQLDALNTGLSMALPKVVCHAGRPSEQAEILRNVFVLFFIDKIQPLGSTINQLYYDMLPVYQTLSASPLNAELRQSLIQKTEQSFSRYQTSIHDHVRLWQVFFKRCHLSPSSR